MSKGRVRLAVYLVAAMGAAFILSQCVMIPIPRPVPLGNSRSLAQMYPKGSVVEVVGVIRVERNSIYLEDDASEAVFMFVGLGRDDSNTLSRNEGKRIKIRLKVISLNEGTRINADFMAMVPR